MRCSATRITDVPGIEGCCRYATHPGLFERETERYELTVDMQKVELSGLHGPLKSFLPQGAVTYSVAVRTVEAKTNS